MSITKGNKAIAKMAAQLEQCPHELKVVRARRLCNGSMVYEFRSTEVAAWIRKEKA